MAMVQRVVQQFKKVVIKTSSPLPGVKNYVTGIIRVGRVEMGSLLLVAASLHFSVLAEDSLHTGFNQLLVEHVKPIANGASTQVDYSGFKRDSARLTTYLESLAKVPKATFDSWENDDQLAFLINAYNAYTIELILTKYPGINSIRDLGGFFSSPWKKEIAPLLGKNRTLDEIEHELIRGGNKYNEPRIHFAVNCASIGCPALREEAYIGARLDLQLEAQTKRFLSDTSRNRMDGDILKLSKIFDWYGEDFESAGKTRQSWRGTSTLNEFILLYKDALKLSPQQVSALVQGNANIEFLEYDWALNDTQ